MVHYSYPTASCQTETLRLWVKGNGYKNTRNTCLVMSYCNRATALYRQNAVNSNGVGGALLGAVPKGLWKVRHILRFAHVTRHAVGDSLLRALTRTNIRTECGDKEQHSSFSVMCWKKMEARQTLKRVEMATQGVLPITRGTQLHSQSTRPLVRITWMLCLP